MSEPVKYRNAKTGDTWSGRGIKPRWLVVALEEPGVTLHDFLVADQAAVAPTADQAGTALAAPAQETTVRALAQRLRYSGAIDPATLENSAREAIRRIGMGIFELGGYLLLMREACEHGQFLPALERLGLEHEAARRYMKVTSRFANSSTSRTLERAGMSKLVELLPLDDDQVEELLEHGQTGELALDDVATMSVKELRAAVREAKQEQAAQEDLLASKSKQIDKLTRDLKRIQAAPPDQVLAELKKEAAAIAHDAQGLIMGALRQAVIAIQAHGEDGVTVHRAYLAGLLAPIQVELNMLRDECVLPDLAAEAIKTPFVQFMDAEDAAQAAAAKQAPAAE